jgi:ankyrin repeat protein
MRKEWLAVLGIFVTGLAAAAGPAPAASSTATPARGKSMHAQSMDLCRLQRATVRGMWQRHYYDASPIVSDIMVAALDGDIGTVRKGLQGLPPDQVARWRQTALSQAELGNRPDAVRALVADGADPNGRAWIPPYAPHVWTQAIRTMAHDAHLGPLAESMRKNGAELNQGMWMAPPLIEAARCDETGVMTTLLESGASVNATWNAQSKSGDALLLAALGGHTAAVRLLLEHGANTCHDDETMARIAQRMQHRKVVTVADIARRNGLPADLVARLRCPAP